jgi:hypothetical protein
MQACVAARSEPGLLGGARLVYDAEAMFSLRDIARAALDGRPLAAAEQQAAASRPRWRWREGADAIVAVSRPRRALPRAGYADGARARPRGRGGATRRPASTRAADSCSSAR